MRSDCCKRSMATLTISKILMFIFSTKKASPFAVANKVLNKNIFYLTQFMNECVCFVFSIGFVSKLKPTDMELSRLAQRIDKDHGYQLQVGLIPDEVTRGRLHADYGRSFAMEVFYSLRQWVHRFARKPPTFESLSEILQYSDVNPHVLCLVCNVLIRTNIIVNIRLFP